MNDRHGIGKAEGGGGKGEGGAGKGRFGLVIRGGRGGVGRQHIYFFRKRKEGEKKKKRRRKREKKKKRRQEKKKVTYRPNNTAWRVWAPFHPVQGHTVKELQVKQEHCQPPAEIAKSSSKPTSDMKAGFRNRSANDGIRYA